MSLRARLRDESGVALAVVMGALLVLSTFSLMIANEAMTQNTNSVKDRGSKRALSAASAGLSLARYRLNTAPPADTLCMDSGTTGPPWGVAIDPVTGFCPLPAPEALGNGATFKYVVGRASPAPATCGAAQTIPGGARCATAVGTVNGQTRRIQTLLARERGALVFNLAGVVGFNSVSLSNASNVNTDVGADALVQLTTGATVQGQALLPPGGTYSTSNGGNATGGRRDITNPSPPFRPTIPDFPWALTQQTAAPAPSPIYNAATKALNISGTTVLTIPAGTYVVCSMNLANQAEIRIPAGAAVAIYVDSPARAGSGCPAGSGTVTLGQGGKINETAGAAENFDLFVYGTNPAASPTDVDLGNHSIFYGSIYAPQSTVSVENAAAITGAIAGKDVIFQNTGNLQFPASLKTKEYPLPGRFQVTGWTECRPTPSLPQSLASGC